jgi:hypothetical protein
MDDLAMPYYAYFDDPERVLEAMFSAPTVLEPALKICDRTPLDSLDDLCLHLAMIFSLNNLLEGGETEIRLSRRGKILLRFCQDAAIGDAGTWCKSNWTLRSTTVKHSPNQPRMRFDTVGGLLSSLDNLFNHGFEECNTPLEAHQFVHVDRCELGYRYRAYTRKEMALALARKVSLAGRRVPLAESVRLLLIHCNYMTPEAGTVTGHGEALLREFGLLGVRDESAR